MSFWNKWIRVSPKSVRALAEEADWPPVTFKMIKQEGIPGKSPRWHQNVEVTYTIPGGQEAWDSWFDEVAKEQRRTRRTAMVGAHIEARHALRRRHRAD